MSISTQDEFDGQEMAFFLQLLRPYNKRKFVFIHDQLYNLWYSMSQFRTLLGEYFAYLTDIRTKNKRRIRALTQILDRQEKISDDRPSEIRNPIVEIVCLVRLNSLQSCYFPFCRHIIRKAGKQFRELLFLTYLFHISVLEDAYFEQNISTF